MERFRKGNAMAESTCEKCGQPVGSPEPAVGMEGTCERCGAELGDGPADGASDQEQQVARGRTWRDFWSCAGVGCVCTGILLVLLLIAVLIII